MATPTTYGLAALLLASLALNARLWTTRAPSSPARTPAASSTASHPDPDACERRLEACQQQSWKLAERALVAPPSPAPAPKPAAPPAPSGSDLAAQANALCTKAQQNLRETWQRDRDAIAFGMSQGLSDKKEQEKNVATMAARMHDVAGLSDRDAAAVQSAYHDKRLARIAEAQAALAKQPQDFSGLLDATRGLLADEDSILERIGGPSARDAWRQDQLETRTAILALVATMADRDWDDSIHW